MHRSLMTRASLAAVGALLAALAALALPAARGWAGAMLPGRVDMSGRWE